MPVLASTGLLTVLAWAFIVHLFRAGGSPGMAMDMPGMDMAAASSADPMAGAGWLALFGMWVAMMVGMMLPSALPSVLLYSAMARQRVERGQAPLPVAGFVGGYLLVWTTFSVVAALIQTRLRVALLPAAATSHVAAIAAGALLIATGGYQWSRYKAACLSHCRSPLGHFTAHWREGVLGALRMGGSHGLLCVGCCWLLMLLLFVGGVMNPWWIAALALLVLVEKVGPRGNLVGRVAGVGLVLWGVGLIVRG